MRLEGLACNGQPNRLELFTDPVKNLNEAIQGDNLFLLLHGLYLPKKLNLRVRDKSRKIYGIAVLQKTLH